VAAAVVAAGQSQTLALVAQHHQSLAQDLRLKRLLVHLVALHTYLLRVMAQLLIMALVALQALTLAMLQMLLLVPQPHRHLTVRAAVALVARLMDTLALAAPQQLV
jgi:hypothetical protein